MSASARLRWPLIRSALSDYGGRSIVEVGSGRGAMAAILARDFIYRGYEPDAASFSAAALAVASSPTAAVFNEPIPETPDRLFDALVAFEVLEHIEDDGAALAAWQAWVVDGGRILVSVPGNPRRFGPWDEHVGHIRRYRRKDLVRLFEQAGLEIISASAWGMPLGYLLEAVRNVVARRVQSRPTLDERTAESGRLMQPPSFLSGLLRAAVVPFVWLQRPFRSTDLGVGFVVVARKRAE